MGAAQSGPRHDSQATRKLAAFAAALNYEALPNAVIDKLKISVLDTLGCCLFGATLPAVRKLASLAASEGSGGRATLMGLHQQATPSMAALVNASGAHSFQLDEIHIQATLHPGSIAVPVAWALAESRDGIDGRALITALVAGYEVGLRVGLAAKGAMFARGYHNQGTTGTFVAGATAGRLLGLDEAHMVHALGLAGSQAAGLMAVQDGAMAKGFHSGRAAQSGLYAAELAALGFTGIPNVLEVAYGGFLSTLAGEYDEAPLTAELGERWHILDVGYKPAPASNGSVTAMNALDALMRAHDLKAEDIEEVIVGVSDNTLHHCGWEYTRDKVQGVLAAQMNLRYGIAIMALEREATAAQFTPDRLFRTETMAFIERIRVEHEPKYDGNGGVHRVACRMALRCRDGASYKTEVLYRKGSNEAPMTADEQWRKFETLASPAIGAAAARELADQVASLEGASTLAKMSRLLAGQGR